MQDAYRLEVLVQPNVWYTMVIMIINQACLYQIRLDQAYQITFQGLACLSDKEENIAEAVIKLIVDGKSNTKN